MDIDAAGVARVLGVSRRRILELARSERHFPRPNVGGGGYWLWPRESIERINFGSHDEASYEPPALPVQEPRLYGTPERITSELHELLELAFDEALSLNHHGVGPEHLALALLRPEAPGSAGAVLRSFGLTLEDARTSLNESRGDPYDPHDLELAVPPATRFPFERAKLEALDLRDEHVSSEHLLLDLIDETPKRLSEHELAARLLTPCLLSSPELLWRVQSSKSLPSILRTFFEPRGAGADTVRARVISLTEDPARQFEPLPPPPPREPKSPWAGGEPELAPSPLDHHPARRRP